MSAPSTQRIPVIATVPPITFEAGLSRGELVPVPPKVPPAVAYARALDLLAATRAGVAAVTSRKGPTAAPSVVDTWLSNHYWISDVAAAAAALSGLGTFAMALTQTGPLVATSAFLAGAIATSVHTARAGKRLEAKAEKHAAEVFDTADLDRMLAAFRVASPYERAMVGSGVERLLAPLDATFSAKAAASRERLLQGLPVMDEPTQRAARLASVVDGLRNGESLATHLDGIRRVLGEASPEERVAYAERLEADCFPDEKPVMAADKTDVRALYALLEKSRRGEAPEMPSAEA